MLNCSTAFVLPVIPPRWPFALAVLIVLSLFLQSTAELPGRPWPLAPVPHPWLVEAARAPGRGRWVRRGLRRAPGRASPGAAGWLRLLARELFLLGLLQTSGVLNFAPAATGLLLLPALQLARVRGTRRTRARHSFTGHQLARNLQRLYQVSVLVLLVSTLARVGLWVHATAPLRLSLLVGGWVFRPDAETEVRIASRPKHAYQITLRGTFTLFWEPRDGFEKWMLILFLRRLRRPGAAASLLSQRVLAQPFGSTQGYVSRWEGLVAAHGWHVLSDRFRHQLHSALPEAELSRQILQVWVPAFWLSAWDVREQLIAGGRLLNREALNLEDLYALAQHTGFAQVRELLLQRFDLHDGQLLAREPWWLDQLLALNERLIQKLQRGERLTPQELVDLEPLRLKTSEKQAPAAPPLAATLQRTLFEPPTERVPAPVRCTYCGSDQVAPKSKQPRVKKVYDDAGDAHTVETLRYYCHNPACPYRSFTHFPPGVLPHSAYPVQVRVRALEVYATLLSTYRRSARVLGVRASTVYGWLVTLSPSATALAAYLGVIRTSGVIGIDDKWLKVCSPSAVPKHGQHPHAIWNYAYFAIDMYSDDLLALEVYPEHTDAALRQFLLELKAQGLQPRVVVSDLDPAYGRMLPLIFPQAVHHECIFHALQNAQRQLTQVYGKHYDDTNPAAATLHEQVVDLFHAQTPPTVRKRFAALLALRETYVAQTPAVACVFDSLEAHFPKLVNAIGNSSIPRTNDATERVIRRLDQHYLTMCGFDSLESARVYLRLFQLVYRLTPFAEDNRGPKRGKCPLELAGYDLTAFPIANFFAHLQLPVLAQTSQTVSQ